MRVKCQTNLDLNDEQWPDELPSVPRVGEVIQSATVWPNRFQLELQVVGVTWKKSGGLWCPGEWVPVIELHMASWQRKIVCANRANGCDCADGSICAFYHWYAPAVGRSASAFI